MVDKNDKYNLPVTLSDLNQDSKQSSSESQKVLQYQLEIQNLQKLLDMY